MIFEYRYYGEVSEWSIVHPWKGCVESNQPGVRITCNWFET